MQQFLRCGLAFVFSGVVGSSIATDSLFGTGGRRTSKVNVGALKKGYVNFYGICCSGLSAMYRYDGVIPLSNAIGAELVLGTGALDLWVADVEDVYPGIMDVARCHKTTIVTTSDSARLPGAEHYAYKHDHSNINQTRAIAEKIITRAIESFTDRREIPVFIPPYEVDAEVGFTVEYIQSRFGGMKPIVEALKSGEILGVVNIVGCNNPRVIYEKATVDVAETLLKNNVLVFTNGCASSPLLKLGFCNTDALKKTGEGLRGFLQPDFPPVWHMGECIDNARASGAFGAVANEAGQVIKDMPFAFASPEWSNEKGIGAALGSTMNVDVDPIKLANKIIEDLKEKRKSLGWK